MQQQSGPAQRNQYQPNPWNRSSVYHGEKYVHGIDGAPFSIFKNQVIPVNVHDLLKGFRPKSATIRVLSLGQSVFLNGINTVRKERLVISQGNLTTGHFLWKGNQVFSFSARSSE